MIYFSIAEIWAVEPFPGKPILILTGQPHSCRFPLLLAWE
jgi:hypothetical protein